MAALEQVIEIYKQHLKDIGKTKTTLEAAVSFYDQQSKDFAWCEDYAAYLQQLTGWLKELKMYRDLIQNFLVERIQINLQQK